ncbi:uncharacterized protein LOC129778601 [Toxorhynchites rutilus septentrionalis]|uniref:uncharacterized protein LOC129778601 n=1 Tax=Toxorhynchites rutilus septentrionalis TaxID=329112 RepID=UPI002479E468|nr:uncharacterized protein LOC129778601 [Toxorhynchites rutilus septentrionalis]
MNVKIYLSSKLVENCTFCQLFGLIEVQRDEIRFVVLDSKLLPGTYLIGEICSESDYRRLQESTDPTTQHRDALLLEENFLRLSISDRGRIKHVTTKVKGVTIETLNKVLIIYDEKGFGNLAENVLPMDENGNDLLHLARLIKSSKPRKNLTIQDFLEYSTHSRFIKTMRCVLGPLALILRVLFRKTALFYHFSEWTASIETKGYKSAKWALIFDIGFGVAVLSMVLYFGNPGVHFMGNAEIVVHYLRELLQTLRGSPIGLKLNAPLNDFFLNCFLYHVDLWWTFLIIVSPAIHFLFIPLSILGLLGLSFQLAMLSDLIILISLHAHCFYIYAAVLYRIEIGGIRALCRIVLGKKKNVLRDRVESHEYMNRQLFLATLTFAVLLFLLPTILVYYVVFATLRFGIYCVSYLLMTIRRTILQFPFAGMIRWIRGVYTNLDSLEIFNIGSYAKENITIIYIAPKASSFWGDRSCHQKQADTDGVKMGPATNTISIGQFFASLVRGEMVAFIQPDENVYRHNIRNKIE